MGVTIGKTPPSVKPDLIGGHFRSFRGDATGFLTRLSKLGDVTGFRMGPQKALFINHPELVRDLFVVNADKFVKGRALQRAKTLLGEGLLTSEGDLHLRQRRMIQPAFHRGRIAEYAKAMVDLGERMSETWSDGETRDIDQEMMHLTLQIVGKTLFGADVGDDADEIGQAMTTLVKMFNYLLLPFSEWLEKLPLPQSRRLRRARRTLDDVIYSIIEDRRRSGEGSGDLLSMLLLAQDEESGIAMSNDQVRDEALTLFLAGHETTANALTWTWYLLSQNPATEARLHEELNSALQEEAGADGENLSGGDGVPKGEARSGTSGDDRDFASRPPHFADLPHLKYTEAVLAESMRLFPPAWAIGRLSKADHHFGGYAAPAGTLILASPFVMHRDARFWHEPEKFRPERWCETSVKDAGQRYVYFPFGGGVRRCIGESFAWTEGTLLLASIARKWKLRLSPGHKIGLQPMITLRPKFGMRMQISRR